MRLSWIAILILLTFSGAQICAGTAFTSSAEAYRLSRKLLLEGKYQQALEVAEQALRLNPNSWEAESVAGQTELALGDLAAAESHLVRALAMNPGLVEARRALALTYFKELQADVKLNREAQASAILSKLDHLLADHYRERIRLAAFLVSENAYTLAAEEFERLRVANPGSYELNYDLALADYRAGRESQAIALLRKLLAQKDDAELEDLLGDAEEKAGNSAEADAAFRRAMELEPQSEDYRFDYAQSLESHWDLARALGVFETGTSYFPRSGEMWLGLGATYYLSGRYREAAQTLLHAAEIQPDSPKVYSLLGLAYEAAGPFQLAIARRFARYLSSNPPDAMAHYYDGKILLERNRQGKAQSLAEARRQLEEAVKLDPRLAGAHTQLAVLFEMEGEFRAARGELEKAVQFDPESSTAYYNLARLDRKLGETAQAQEALEQFQRLKVAQKKNRDQEAVRGFLARAKENGLEASSPPR